MRSFIEHELKECLVLDEQVSVNSSMKESNKTELDALADALIDSIQK